MVRNFVFFILITAGCGITTYKRDEVQVKSGIGACVSNDCSSNALVDCEVHGELKHNIEVDLLNWKFLIIFSIVNLLPLACLGFHLLAHRQITIFYAKPTLCSQPW